MFKKKIKRIISVEGMHCGHCASKVEASLKEINEVEKVKVNLEKKEVEVTLSAEIDNNILKESIEKVDFQVTNIA